MHPERHGSCRGSWILKMLKQGSGNMNLAEDPGIHMDAYIRIRSHKICRGAWDTSHAETWIRRHGPCQGFGRSNQIAQLLRITTRTPWWLFWQSRNFVRMQKMYKFIDLNKICKSPKNPRHNCITVVTRKFLEAHITRTKTFEWLEEDEDADARIWGEKCWKKQAKIICKKKRPFRGFPWNRNPEINWWKMENK